MENRSKILDFERPRLDDPLYKENPSPHGFGMNANDGLPSPAIAGTFADAEAADLTPERFVCMASTDRPQCAFYRRQLLPSADKANKVCIRYCTAVRGETGEFVDLGNSEVLACEFRSPRDPSSEQLLAEFDEEIFRRQEARRKENEAFDPLKELEKNG